MEEYWEISPEEHYEGILKTRQALEEQYKQRLTLPEKFSNEWYTD